MFNYDFFDSSLFQINSFQDFAHFANILIFYFLQLNNWECNGLWEFLEDYLIRNLYLYSKSIAKKIMISALIN